MPLSLALGRRAQLRDSYIAISKFIRGPSNHPSPRLRQGFSCQRVLRSTESQQTIAETQQDVPNLDHQQEGLVEPKEDSTGPVSQYRKIFDLPNATANWETWDLRPDIRTTIFGYVTSTRRGARSLDFMDLVDPQLRKTLQLVIDEKTIGQRWQKESRKIRPHSPVAVSGQLSFRTVRERSSGEVTEQDQSGASSDADGPNITYYQAGTEASGTEGGNSAKPEVQFHEFKNNAYVGEVMSTRKFEMVVTSIRPLNHFPEDIIAQADTKLPVEQRHLQLRTSSNLRKTLQARSKAQTECRKYLFMKGFDEIETPILFKSTPEGAREFLVPTRQKGLAYALPQSPQQFKQILMASGISKYFQFAKCFRDEDMRADRQPEFTQLDIEMSFASAEDVMKITERLIQVLWQTFFQEVPFQDKIKYPQEYLKRDIPHYARLYFPRLTYHGAMKQWGSDKPDTRLGSAIHQVQDFLDPALKSKISSLKDPIIDFMRIRVDSNPRKTKDFISSFLLSPSAAEYIDNPHGAPGIFIYDPSKPMSGLSTFEYEAAERITEMVHPQRGDLLVLQARPDKPFTGESSTMIGNLRRDLHMALISEGLLVQPKRHEFLWIEDFPLFSPTNDTDPGQGGKAGIKSTHHPFTAPKKWGDVEKMATDPLSCTAAHFDLVIDGVEVGGGSRRIHDSKIQEMVLKDILKVPARQVEEFRPLLEALRAGCPPHAGIALGFDRLMAILRNASTVRDVIAFPKSAHGEDKMAKAPSAVNAARWAEYHMVPEGGETLASEKEKKDEPSPAPVDVDVERELRSVASSDSKTPGATQPDQDDVTPSTPS